MKFNHEKLARTLAKDKLELQLKLERNISMREYSISVGVSQNTLWSIINGTRIYTDVNTIVPILQYLDLKFEEFVEDE